MDELKTLLSDVKKENNLEKIKDFLKNNSDISSGDVIRFIVDNCDIPNNNDEIPEWAQEDDE